MQAQAIVLDDSPVIYRKSKIGNDFGVGGGGNGRLHRPKGTSRVAQFTAAQSAKMSNSGTQDDSPVWGIEYQIGNEFLMIDFVSLLFKSGLCCLTLEALQLTQGRIPQSRSD